MSRESGVAALVELLRAIEVGTSLDYDAAPDGDLEDEPIDYAGVVELIAASVQANLVDAEAEHREGFLRALAVLFVDVADGGLPPDLLEDQWDPIAKSEPSFAARAAAASVIRRRG